MKTITLVALALCGLGVSQSGCSPDCTAMRIDVKSRNGSALPSGRYRMEVWTDTEGLIERHECQIPSPAQNDQKCLPLGTNGTGAEGNTISFIFNSRAYTEDIEYLHRFFVNEMRQSEGSLGYVRKPYPPVAPGGDCTNLYTSFDF